MVFSNIHVSFEGHTYQLDYVVAGDNGVFIVEVKKHKGRISEEEDHPKWNQFKISSGLQSYIYDSLIHNLDHI